MDKASPNDNWAVVLDVGTIPYPDSFTSGINNLIFADLYKFDFLFETIPIRVILLVLENFIIFLSSSVFPE